MNQVEPFSGEEEILQHDSHDNMYDENSEEIKQEALTTINGRSPHDTTSTRIFIMREGEHSTDRNIEDSSLYDKDDNRLEPPTLDKFVPEQPPVEEAKEESKAEEGKEEAKKEPKENPRKFAPQPLKLIEEHKKAMEESGKLLMGTIGAELLGVKYDYISFYDLTVIRSYEKGTSLMLGNKDSKLFWTDNLYLSSDQNITPVTRLPISAFKNEKVDNKYYFQSKIFKMVKKITNYFTNH